MLCPMHTGDADATKLDGFGRVGVVGVNQALESGTVERCVERLRVDAAALDLQLSLPGVDHLETACQLLLQLGDVAQLVVNVVL